MILLFARAEPNAVVFQYTILYILFHLPVK